MKTLKVSVSDKYVISDVIKNLSSDVWEDILDSLHNLLAIGMDLSDTDNKSKILADLEANSKSKLKEMELKHLSEVENNKIIYEMELKNIKSTYEKQLELYEKTLKEEQNKTNEIVNNTKNNMESHHKEELALLHKQKSMLEEQYKNTLATLENSVKSSYETKINDMLKDKTMLEEQYKNTLATLENSVKSSYETKISDMLKDKTMLEEQLNTLLNQYKTIEISIKSMYDSQLLTLREQVLELKDKASTSNSNYEKQIDSIKSTYEKQLQEYKSSDNIYKLSLEKQLEDCKISSEKQIDSIKSTYEKQLQEYKSSDNIYKLSLEKQLEECKLSVDKQIDSIKSTYEARINEIKNNHNTLKNIETALEPMKKIYGGTNNDKGISGENTIRYILQKLYTDAVISDVSHLTSSGDIIFKRKKLNCIIEVKNKKTITIEDVDKFIRDIKANNTLINSGIFVSLLTNDIPNKSKEPLLIEYIDSIPVIYIHMSAEIVLQASITMLDQLVNREVNTSENTNMLVTHFNSYYKSLNELREYFENEISRKNKELKNLQKNLSNCIRNLEAIDNDYNYINANLNPNNIAVDDDNDTDDDNKSTITNTNNTVITQEIKDKIIQNYIKYASITNVREQLDDNKIKGSYSKIIKTSDYKNIVEEAKLTICKHYITDEIKQTLLNNTSNDAIVKLTRKELIEKGIFNEVLLRKLSKLLRLQSTKNNNEVINYIYLYITS